MNFLGAVKLINSIFREQSFLIILINLVDSENNREFFGFKSWWKIFLSCHGKWNIINYIKQLLDTENFFWMAIVYSTVVCDKET